MTHNARDVIDFVRYQRFRALINARPNRSLARAHLARPVQVKALERRVERMALTVTLSRACHQLTRTTEMVQKGGMPLPARKLAPPALGFRSPKPM